MRALQGGEEAEGRGAGGGKSGEKLICLCILTVFIHAAAAALMRNTFGPISLPYADRRGDWGAVGIQNAPYSSRAHTHKRLQWAFFPRFSFPPSSLIVLNHHNCRGK